MSALYAKKQYGQNFLTDPRIPRRIVENSGITPDDNVIEIGPGRGILTRELAKAARKVAAVEIDRDLIPALEEEFASCGNVKIVCGDILQTDIPRLAREVLGADRVCVCANIPYYITSPIILKLIEERETVRSFTVMVQKEVADRLCARKGSEAYSSLTVLCSYYASVKKLFAVPAGCFTPKPKVDSAVVRFDIYPEPPVKPKDETLFLELIRSAFAYRRKTLYNCVKSSHGARFSNETVERAIQSAGFGETVRGEELDIFGFAAISDKLLENE